MHVTASLGVSKNEVWHNSCVFGNAQINVFFAKSSFKLFLANFVPFSW